VRRAELVVVGLLSAGALCAVAFIVVYALDRIPHQTQFLGLTIGLSFLFIAGACGLAGLRIIGGDEIAEEYPTEEHTSDAAQIEQVIAESGDRFTRKRLVVTAGLGAAGALGAALVVPALSLGPALDLESLTSTPWVRGRRLVGEDGRPLLASAIEEDTFYTAYPEHADREQIAAPVVVVRLPRPAIHLPAGRAAWAPDGILAYSKVCTHAGCAVSLYRKPTFPPVQPEPALVCPCHYSTFDPATGGTVLFGPAGRPLPQLPLAIGPNGELRAAGTFSGPVGPAWWGVRSRKAQP
jgi:ubiquinol-cytochrome c reductase iron-sulfur subunit